MKTSSIATASASAVDHSLPLARITALQCGDAAVLEGSLGRWHLLRADALLAGGRPREAAAALESAAAYLNGSEARDAAYRSAQVYSEQLGDHARALHVLKASGVLGPEKFVHARGMELWVRLLVELDRRWEASAVARRYLRTYPHSPEAAAMRAIADFNRERPSPPLL